jgi:hypothetical protein
MFSEKFGWQPIDTAPIDKDVALIVTDGQGEPANDESTELACPTSC